MLLYSYLPCFCCMIRNYESNEKTEKQCASVSEVLPSVFLILISQMCSPKVFQKWRDGWYRFCQEGLHIWCSICIFCTRKMSDSKHNNKVYLLSLTMQLLCYNLWIGFSGLCKVSLSHMQQSKAIHFVRCSVAKARNTHLAW